MQTILEVKELAVSFQNGKKPAVRDVNFTLNKGEIIGLVGESGSGKSLSALSIMGLLPSVATFDYGSIIFKGEDLAKLKADARRELCGRNMGMVFQEPLTALNPVLTIGEQLAEIYRYRQNLSRSEANYKSIEMLEKVALPNPKEAIKSYPHRFSGGMRQRVVIAMALALAPEILIADEPTTALDPTIAAQILALISRLAAENNSSVLFITHNLHLLRKFARRVLVMYTGLIVEEALLPQVFEKPAHPYTEGLLKALPPSLMQEAPKSLTAIEGVPPIPGQWPKGCPFEPRCVKKMKICLENLPPLFELADGRRVRCFLYSSNDFNKDSGEK